MSGSDSPVPEGLQLTPFDPAFHEDPYAVYRELRQAAPMHHESVSMYDGDSWTVSSFDLVNQLLRDERLSADPRKIGMARDPRAVNPVTTREPNMMNLDNPDHHRLRMAVSKAFTPASVEQFRGRIAEIFEDCAKDCGDEFDVVSTIAKPLPTRVIAEYIGYPAKDHVAFKAWTDDLLLQGYPMPTGEQWETIVAADTALRDYTRDLISQRRAVPADDLISRLIVDDTLPDNDVLNMACLLIGAGNFTTTDLISNAILLALQHEATDADVPALIEECLRFDSPSLSLRRFVTEDVTVGDHVIRKGSVVALNLGAANHDEAHFEDADSFCPARTPNPHMAFGRGIHHCLGAPLARLEAEVTVAAFFHRFPTARLKHFKRTRRMAFRGCDRLEVTC